MNAVTPAVIDALNFDAHGLIPAVVQDSRTGSVLMLAYMNKESIQKTLETGETHFWSRKRGGLWHKGQTSGNRQQVESILADCDSDTLLVRVEQSGSACHTGAYSCFYTPLVGFTAGSRSLGEEMGMLSRVIAQRAKEMPEESYTAKLLQAGVDRILKKVGEEAGEVIIAAKNHKRDEIAWEVADLLYHTLVLLEHEGVPPADVATELQKRSTKKVSRTG
jgi:phosphoribosyl-ATP pyrophosphohydrolase/phosphoribosyl-AMP cyclohydrolase